jgi:hypothetical protein
MGDEEISKAVMRVLSNERVELGTGAGVITAVDIQRGSGDVVYVDVFYSLERGCGMCSVPDRMRTVQSELSDALRGCEHSIRLVEAA